MERIKRLTSYAAHARFLAEMTEADWCVGFIPRQPIDSPYCYSPTHNVMLWNGRKVILVETSHRRFDVFEVPPQERIYATDEEATERYIRTKPAA